MSYPLRYVRPYPGPMPPAWRILARRRWNRAMLERNQAKAWNFAHNYGRIAAELRPPTPEECIVFEDHFPWTNDAYAQMFHTPSVTNVTDKPTTRR